VAVKSPNANTFKKFRNNGKGKTKQNFEGTTTNGQKHTSKTSQTGK